VGGLPSLAAAIRLPFAGMRSPRKSSSNARCPLVPLSTRLSR
jgi:hypothetical protein